MPLATGVFGPIPNSPRENYAEEQSRSRPRPIFLVTLDDVQRDTFGGVDSDNVTVSSGRSRRKRPGRSREQCTERAGRKTMETTRDGRSFKALESGAVEGGRLNDSATDRTLSIPYRKGCQGGVAFHYTPHPRRNKTRVVTSFASLAMPLHYQILIMDIPIDDPDDDFVLVVVILWDGSLSMSSNLRSDYGGLHWS
jgi:hypothetical protein